MSNCDFVVKYNSKVTPRNTISRSSGLRENSDRSNLYTVNSYKQVGYGGFVPLQRSRSAAVLNINENKECEKRALCSLNDKFASLIERVRYLEALNKKIQMEYDTLRSLEGQKTEGIRRMFETEITECDNLSSQLFKEYSKSEDKRMHTELQADKLKEKVDESNRVHEENRVRCDNLLKKMAANESEISLLKRRLDDLDTEIKNLKTKSSFLVDEIQNFTMKFDQEKNSCLRLEVEKSSLEEQLYYLHQTHGQELENVRNKIFKDVGLDSSVFFKSELSKHIGQLREEYEERNLKQKEVMEQRYWVKIQELQKLPIVKNDESLNNLNKSLKTAISDQNRENADMKKWQADTIAKLNDLEVVLIDEIQIGKDKIIDKNRELKSLGDQFENMRNDFDMMTRMKTTLETEILRYRRLVEGDHDRRGLKQAAESIGVIPKSMTGTPFVTYEIVEAEPEPPVEKKVSIAERKPSAVERKQSVADKRQSVAERRQSVAERRQSVAERKQSVASEHDGCSETVQTVQFMIKNKD